MSALWNLLGKLHPVIVHFPIAFLIGAAAVEFVRRRPDNKNRDRYQISGTAQRILFMGAAAAIVAAVFGFANAETAGHSGSTADILSYHKTLGVASSAFALVVCVFSIAAERSRTARQFYLYRTALAASAVLITLSGHHGAMLIFGENYFEKAWIQFSRGATESAPAGSPSSIVQFDRDVLPILTKRCFACHSGENPESEFSLKTKELAFKGGKSGKPAIVPGRAHESKLIQLVSQGDPSRQMPPRGKPLSTNEIETLTKWIDAGAPWSDPSAATGEHWHWAYRPPARPPIPNVKNINWPNQPLDNFILANLEKENLLPSPEAAREELLRRVSLDLIGIPPTVEEIDIFLQDPRADAYDRAVDRLLASSHFGERWARPWLDLARYADTHGYEKDSRRSMWPYRDWVIDAYNRDLPFDQFTIEQIAGDLLPNASVDQLLATGFHRNTMINEEGGVDPEEFRVDAVVDRVNTTASVWLGSTFACAQCHDHKFDPLSTKEYYQLFAFFNSVEEETKHSGHENYANNELVVRRAALEWRDAYINLTKEISDIEQQAAGAEPKSPLAERLSAARAELAKIPAGESYIMKELPKPRETRIHLRGNFLTKGEAVGADVPAVFPRLPAGAPSNRLGLAKWLVDAKNPLTARVQVNRFWSLLFGRGIVETEEDFGTRGDEPSNPELLDWLAVEFQRKGWSVKTLLKTIVTSSTYKQSSNVTAELLERDPANKLYARGPRHRLEAEMLRDNALAVSGLLSKKIGGPSVFPPQPDGIWTMIYSNDKWVYSLGEDRYRRGIYTFWRRTIAYPTFTTFDAPSREASCLRRPRTNTPLQALTILNDPQFVEAAVALAKLMIDRGGEELEGRIIYGFRSCTGRHPNPIELNRLVKLASEQTIIYQNDAAAGRKLLMNGPAPVASWLAGGAAADAAVAEFAALAVVANVLLNLDETLTKN